jgi:hypothetical protein
VHTVLGEFVSEVQTLRISGQLTGTTAASLAHEARTTAAEAAQQFHRAKAASTESHEPAQTTTAAATTIATTATTPAEDAPTQTAPTRQGATTSVQADGTPQQNDRGSDGISDSPWPRGHGHGYGHGHGAEASAWWTALRNWVDSNSRGGDGNG